LNSFIVGALPAAGVSSFVGWAKPLAAVDEIALDEIWAPRAEVDGIERRMAEDRIMDIVYVIDEI
jgi:hypothetical protein